MPKVCRGDTDLILNEEDQVFEEKGCGCCVCDRYVGGLKAANEVLRRLDFKRCEGPRNGKQVKASGDLRLRALKGHEGAGRRHGTVRGLDSGPTNGHPIKRHPGSGL